MGVLMTVHVAHINALHMSPADFAAAKDREFSIMILANEIKDAHDRDVDMSSEEAALCYFLNNRIYFYSQIKDILTPAFDLARETIAAAAEGLR